MRVHPMAKLKFGAFRYSYWKCNLPMNSVGWMVDWSIIISRMVANLCSYILFSMFSFVGSVGDQDWLTLVSFEWPELVYILPCAFNVDEHR